MPFCTKTPPSHTSAIPYTPRSRDSSVKRTAPQLYLGQSELLISYAVNATSPESPNRQQQFFRLSL